MVQICCNMDKPEVVKEKRKNFCTSSFLGLPSIVEVDQDSATTATISGSAKVPEKKEMAVIKSPQQDGCPLFCSTAVDVGLQMHHIIQLTQKTLHHFLFIDISLATCTQVFGLYYSTMIFQAFDEIGR